ncbi:hypothetical protein CR513_20793, partial [Mucuna pruriens]
MIKKCKPIHCKDNCIDTWSYGIMDSTSYNDCHGRDYSIQPKKAREHERPKPGASWPKTLFRPRRKLSRPDKFLPSRAQLQSPSHSRERVALRKSVHSKEPSMCILRGTSARLKVVEFRNSIVSHTLHTSYTFVPFLDGAWLRKVRSIVYPQLEPAQSYELKSGLIHLSKFHDLAGDDPYKHLKEFHVTCSTMRP